jgi:hypothetical protein
MSFRSGLRTEIASQVEQRANPFEVEHGAHSEAKCGATDPGGPESLQIWQSEAAGGAFLDPEGSKGFVTWCNRQNSLLGIDL